MAAWIIVLSCALLGEAFVYPPSMDVFTSPTTRTSRNTPDDSVHFPSQYNNVNLAQRAPVRESNNNSPPQRPVHRYETTTRRYSAFPTQPPSTRSTADQAIHFFDPDDTPLDLSVPVFAARRRTTPIPRARRTTTTTTTTVEPPPCDCPTSAEFNPVCGEVGGRRITFTNKSYFNCANMCETEKARLLFHNSCRRILNVIQPHNRS